MQIRVKVECEGSMWLVRVQGRRSDQVYACATEEMARGLSSIFEQATSPVRA